MRFLSLFTGIGGFDLGLERAGMECVGQVENDPFCIKVLKKHWPDVPRWGDIKDVTAETLAHHDFRYQPKKEEIRSRWDGVGPRDKERGTGATTTASTTAIDLICGGFPCQPWSAAGKRGGTEDDRDLWPEMLRVIEIVRPNWVIGENVRGFVSMEMGLDRSISDLENIGYAVQAFIVGAVSVGAPHRRDRCWIVAHYDRQQRGADSRKPNAGADWGDNIVGSGENVADAAGSGRGKGDKNTGGPSKGTGAQREWGRSTNGGEDVADTDGSGRQQQRGAKAARAELPAAECGGDVADANSPKRERGYGGEQGKQPTGPSRWFPEPNVGQLADGLSTGLAGWPREPEGVPRVATGVRNRVDKLRALGNSVVPQVVERIGYAILEAEG